MQKKDAQTSVGDIEFGFLEAEFPVPLIVTSPGNLTQPVELNSSSEVDLRSNTVKSERVRSNNYKNQVKTSHSRSMMVNTKKRTNLIKSDEDSWGLQPEKEGSLISSWAFQSNSNSSGSMNPSELKKKIKNYKIIIRVLIRDHTESTRELTN